MFSKVLGDKVSIQKLIVFLYTSKEHMETQFFQSTICDNDNTDEMKRLGINQAKYVQNLDERTLMKRVFFCCFKK